MSENNENLAPRYAFLGKWLSILFWLIIPGTIAGLMGSNTLMNSAPGVYIAGQILNAVCTLASGLIFLKLSAEEDRYKTAGICALIAAAASLFVAIVSGAASTPDWTLFITLPAAVFALIGTYHEFTAHSEILFHIDHALSERWNKLWKWYLGCFIGMFGSVLLMLMAPVLGALVYVAAAIAFIVISIMRFVSLYRTAKIFRLSSMEP